MGDELQLRGHSVNVLRLAAAPTVAGRTLLVSAEADASVRVWDPQTGELVAGPVTIDGARIWDLAAVRLGRDRWGLATCGPRTVTLWDLPSFGAEGSVLRRFDVNYAMGMAVVPGTDTTPDLLVTAEKDLVRVTDPVNGRSLSEFHFPPTPDGQIGNRIYNPTGVRFSDGTAGFAAEKRGELEVWRRAGVGWQGRVFGLDRSFRGAMTYLTGDRGESWLAVAVGRGIEVWDLDTGQRVTRGELDMPFDVLAAVPVAGHTFVAAAFGRGRDSGVVLWDPATRRPASTLFNQHGPAFGDPKLSGVAIHAVTAVPLPDGTVRIASAGNDGAVRVSAPVCELVTWSEQPWHPPKRRGGNYAMVKQPNGEVVGLWLASMEHVQNPKLIDTILYKEDQQHLIGLKYRIEPNTVDGKGGAFVMFEQTQTAQRPDIAEQP